MKTFRDLKVDDPLYCITFGILYKFTVHSICKVDDVMYIYLKESSNSWWIPRSHFDKSEVGSIFADPEKILNYVQESEDI